MGRQEEIEKIRDLIFNTEFDFVNESSMSVATHLIDNGIGSKDRFEIKEKCTNPEMYYRDLRQYADYIEPIEYEKKEKKRKWKNITRWSKTKQEIHFATKLLDKYGTEYEWRHKNNTVALAIPEE